MKYIISLLVISLFVLNTMGGEITKTYYFSDYEVARIGEYQLISFDGCMNTGHTGEPAMPWYAVKLLLPPGEKAVSFVVNGAREEAIPGSYLLYPQQASRPVSMGVSGEFNIDQAVYKAGTAYPENMFGSISTQYMNGHSIALLNICPLTYTPLSGKLSYYREITVTIKTSSTDKSASALSMLSNSASVQNRLHDFVQNPEMLTEYPDRGNKTGAYQLLIITPQAYENEFEQLKELYMYRGLLSEVMTTEEIGSTISGQDQQEKIRNYIIQEYQANSIEYVLLGGDVEHVPYRGFYCYVQSGSGYEDSNIPADLYYNALDGSWNDDGDNLWGEIGEDDLLPDIALGRFSFSNQDELDAMLNKTISYQDSPILGEFANPLLTGEYLYSSPETWGADYLRLLIGLRDDNGYTTNGIPPAHDIDSLYELHQNWGTSTILARINEGRSFVHHVGHANSTYVMHLVNSDITNANFSQVNGTTHNYTLLQSHGCICGAFDDSDCIMERMVAIDNFAVAVVGNSRYGWFNEGQTEGPAAHLHREMVDALYEEKMDRIGLAFMESKIQTAAWVNAPGQHEEGALRWNFYDINILGDPTLQIWVDEPYVVEATFASPILVGAATFDVAVTANSTPVEGLSCTLTKDGEFHGTSISDANGEATITIDPLMITTGTAELTISGYNCQTREYSIVVSPAGGAFLVYHDHILDDDPGGNANGLPDFGESLMMTVDLENAGTAEAKNVSADISTLSEWVSITDDHGEYGNIAAGNTAGTINDFAFDIEEDIPDQAVVEFTVDITDDTKGSWQDAFSITLNAPVLELGEMIIDDNAGGNGNGFLDPGETAIISFGALNNGHCITNDVILSCSTVSNYITPSSNSVNIGTLEPGIIHFTDLEIMVDANTPLGEQVTFSVMIESGAYEDQKDYGTTVGMLVEDWESAGFTTFNWQFDGDMPWTLTTVEPYEGTYCAKSGDIADGQESELFLYIDVLAEGDLRFYRKISSEADWDFLRFYIDYDMLGEWSGELNWELATFPVTQGLHTFHWVYEKDDYLSSGDDCAWIDFIVFPPVDIATGIFQGEWSAGEIALNLRPNPAENIVHIDYSLNTSSEVGISIYDLLGHEVMVVMDNNGHQEGMFTQQIDVSGMKAGIYLCRIITAEGNLCKKLIIR